MARVELFFIDSSLCVTVQYMYSRYIKKMGDADKSNHKDKKNKDAEKKRMREEQDLGCGSVFF